MPPRRTERFTASQAVPSRNRVSNHWNISNEFSNDWKNGEGKIEMKKRFVVLVLFATSLFVQAAEVWEPKAGTGPETNVWRRLVMYGDQWGRKNTAGHGGENNFWRRAANQYIGEPAAEEHPHAAVDFYDADGDGSTNDGYVAYLEFSETNRLNMADWPTVGIYPGAMNWKFYGGVTWNISDSSFGDAGFSLEQGLNIDHAGIFPESAEDHP